jgi:hypothetical protein
MYCQRKHTMTDLEKAVRKFHAAKGRYHTQLACCELFDLLGLPNVRPGQEVAPSLPDAKPVGEIRKSLIFEDTLIPCLLDGAKVAEGDLLYTTPQPVIAPAVEPMPREAWLAVQEGHLNQAAEQYFKARTQLDTAEARRIFYAGHCAGYDAAPTAPPAITPPKETP